MRKATHPQPVSFFVARIFLSIMTLVLATRLAQTAYGQAPAGEAVAPSQQLQASAPDIIGGRQAEPGAWPWQAALVRNGSLNAYTGQYCGGSLIAPTWVLTAAHCVDDERADEVDVVLGRILLSSSEGERIASAAIYVHPQFDWSSLDFDIALIRLERASTQQPVSLYTGIPAPEEEEFVGGIVTGWGRTDFWSYPDELYEVTVPLVSRDTCNAPSVFDGLVTENMLCTGYLKEYVGPCYGDSGGPLVVHKSVADGWQQIGIVSWGAGCGWYENYVVYTRVSQFSDWLQGCLSDTASPTCTGRDDYEPDDGPQQASWINTDGSRQRHTSHDQADRDWVKYEARDNTTYIIETQALGNQSDTLLWLYDSDGVSPLAYDDDGGTATAARLVWRASRNDTFYVEIQDLSGARGESSAYNVRIVQLNTSLYLPVVAYSD